MLGHGHLEVQCFDGVKRIGHIRGKLRKKVLTPLAQVKTSGFSNVHYRSG